MKPRPEYRMWFSPFKRCWCISANRFRMDGSRMTPFIMTNDPGRAMNMLERRMRKRERPNAS